MNQNFKDHWDEDVRFDAGAPSMVSTGTKVAAVLGIIALLSIAGWIYYEVTTVKTSPLNVVVGLRGWPAEETVNENGISEIEQATIDVIDRYSFKSTVLLDIPKDATMQQMVERMSSLGAQHAILIDVQINFSRPSPIKDRVFSSVTVTSQVASLGEETPVKETSVTFGYESISQQAAARKAAFDSLDVLLPEMISQMIESKSVRSLMKAELSSLSADEKKGVNNLYQKRKEAASRRNAVLGFNKNCERADSETQGDRGPLKVTCFGGPCAEQYAVSLSEDGNWALLQSEQYNPYFGIGQTSAGRASPPEQLQLLNVKTGQIEVIDSTLNYYGFASLNTTGEKAYFVDKVANLFAIIELTIKTKKRRVVYSVQVPNRISFPMSSPDNQHVAFFGRETYDGETNAYTMNMNGDDISKVADNVYSSTWIAVTENNHPQLYLATVVWGAEESEGENSVDTDTSATAQTEPSTDLTTPENASSDDNSVEPAAPPNRKHLALIDANTKETVHLIAGNEHPVSSFVGAKDSSVYFLSNTDKCELGIFNVNSKETVWIQTPKCFDSAVLAGDGSVIGVVYEGTLNNGQSDNSEIVRFDVWGQKIVPLTKNQVEERSIAAANGQTILFEKAPFRFNRKFPLVTSCIATYKDEQLPPVTPQGEVQVDTQSP
ncbi:MAG: hypothetical protein JXX29_21950 [Deltaproteobacteria bacterium]|nr:hypothetical protein [Deltaproteobacteria bacterium]MBN2674359.1 hypothetical protein [Deltaproteobacteria bacterium]